MSLRTKILMILAVSPSFAVAGTWADMWQTKDQQGQSNFDSENYSQAANTFEDSNWKGSAHYKAKDYKNAYEEFKKDDSATGLYNQGNALTQMGEYDQAIEAYKKAIEKRYDFEDAKDNMEIAEELKKQKQNQDQNSDGDGDKNNQDKDSKDDKSDKNNDKNDSKDKNKDKSENKSDDKNDDKEKPSDDTKDSQDESDSQNDNDADQQNSEGTPEQQQTQEQKAEARQAKLDKKQAESVLARINDDPGGLLKQKFARDYQRRVGGNQ